MKYRKIQELSAVFDTMEREYAAYARHFDGVQLKENELSGIPEDIARVIKGVFGAQASEWVCRKVPAFDDQRVVDIIHTEAGRKAVKLILLRVPL